MSQCQQGLQPQPLNRRLRPVLLGGIISLVVHLGMFASAVFWAFNDVSVGRFLVLGAHSSGDHEAFFISARKTTSQAMPKQRLPVAKKVAQDAPVAELKTMEPAPVESESLSANQGAPSPTTAIASAQKPIDQMDQSFGQPDEPKQIIQKQQDLAPVVQEPVVQLSKAERREMLQHREIQKEVMRWWRPPLGVPKGTECRMVIHIDQAGLVKDFEIISPSAVKIYDLSIVRVIKKFRFKASLAGKAVTIDFRQ